MSNRNSLNGGTDYIEEGLKPTDVNDTNNALVKKLYGDNSGVSFNNTTVETEVLSVTIPQNDLGANFDCIISASAASKGNTAGTETGTHRIYINGGVVKTVILSLAASISKEHLTIPYFAQALDSTAGDIIIKYTIQHSAVLNAADTSQGIGMIISTRNK